MRIEIEIPKEFEEHFKQDKFKDGLERVMADIKHSLKSGICLCAGRYEHETIEMLKEALENSKPAYPVDKVVEEIKNMRFDFQEVSNNKYHVLQIVKQGGMADDMCEWKKHRIIDNVQMYDSSCYHEFEERCVKKYKFCPYCGKKILCKE